MNNFPIHSRDGLLLAGYHWPSTISHSPMALLVLIHGVAEHSGRYEYLISFFNKNNIAIVTMDLRGHGQSAGQHAFIPTAEAIFQDIDVLLNEARKIYPFCPAVLYGHSMGGTLVLSYTLDRFTDRKDKCPYQCVVVTGPWIRLARPFQPPRPVNALIRTVCRMHPTLNVPLRFDPHKITRDEEIIDSYDKDDNIRRSATLSLARNIGGIAARLDRAKCIFPVPVLVEHGEADAITSHKASSKLVQRGQNIEFKSWPECYHELHSEPEREEIFDYTLKWIHEKILTERF